MPLRENEAEVFNHGLFEGTLLGLEVEVVLPEDVKDSHYDHMMLLFDLAAENEDVIHVNGHDSFVNELLENVVIIIWKVAGLFVSPKNMTRGSKRPQFLPTGCGLIAAGECNGGPSGSPANIHQEF